MTLGSEVAAGTARVGSGSSYRLSAKGIDHLQITLDIVELSARYDPSTGGSEHIRKDLKMTRPVVRDLLDRLMASKRIKMKGENRAATYA